MHRVRVVRDRGSNGREHEILPALKGPRGYDRHRASLGSRESGEGDENDVGLPIGCRRRRPPRSPRSRSRAPNPSITRRPPSGVSVRSLITLVDLAGWGLPDLVQGHKDPIPVFRFDAHGPLTPAKKGGTAELARSANRPCGLAARKALFAPSPPWWRGLRPAPIGHGREPVTSYL